MDNIELICSCGEKYLGWISNLTKIPHPRLCNKCGDKMRKGIIQTYNLKIGRAHV